MNLPMNKNQISAMLKVVHALTHCARELKDVSQEFNAGSPTQLLITEACVGMKKLYQHARGVLDAEFGILDTP